MIRLALSASLIALAACAEAPEAPPPQTPDVPAQTADTLTIAPPPAEPAPPLPPVQRITDEFEVRLLEDGDVWLAGQPTEAGLRMAAAEGVTTVINLRPPGEASVEELGFDPEALAAELGITLVNVPVNGRDYPFTPERLAEMTAALDAADGKTLIHCRSGGRVGGIYAAYLSQKEGVDVDAVLDRLAPAYGFSETGRMSTREMANAFLTPSAP